MTMIKKLQKLFDGADTSHMWTEYEQGTHDQYKFCYYSFYECPKDVAVEVEITQAQCKLAYNTSITMGPIWISIIPGSIASLIDKDPNSWGIFFSNWLYHFDTSTITNSILSFLIENDTSSTGRMVSYPSTIPSSVFEHVEKFKMQPGDRLYAFVRSELRWGSTEYLAAYDRFDNYFTISATMYEETHSGEVVGTLVNRVLRGWGDNTTSQLGSIPATLPGYSSPVQVGAVADWKTITRGEITTTGGGQYVTGFGVRNDGTMWSWGYNSDYGQRGVGTAPGVPSNLYSLHPFIADTTIINIGGDTYGGEFHYEHMGWVDVVTTPDGTRALAVAYNRDKRYEVWAWGNNTGGALGIGNTIHRSIPTQITNLYTGLDGWMKLSTGGNISYAIAKDGILWGWGDNTTGLLGHSTFVNIPPYPYTVYPARLGDQQWRTISTNGECTIGIKEDGTLWSWGKNPEGQLGIGTSGSTIVTVPTRIGSSTSWTHCVAGGQNTTEFGMSSFGIKDGTLWAWGRNNFGQLGLGDTNDRSVPVQVGTDSDWVNVQHLSNTTVAIKSDGSMWGWGENRKGSLGTGDIISRSVPVRIGSREDKWYLASPGLSTHAIKAA